MTRVSQARLASRLVKGKRLAPLSLRRAMVFSTRAWARMSASDWAGARSLSVQVCPVSVVVGGEQGPLRSGMAGFASYDEACSFGPAAGVHYLG